LPEDVEVFVVEQKASDFRDTKITRHETVDGDHGRIETRTYTVIHDVAWLQERHPWLGLQGVVMVESQREIPGATPGTDKIERETCFYNISLHYCGSLSNSGQPSAPIGWSRTAFIGS
jgi:hypothetical protein